MQARVERVFSRPDGSRTKLILQALHTDYSQIVTYKLDVLVCPPRKRTWGDVGDAVRYSGRDETYAEYTRRRYAVLQKYFEKADLEAVIADMEEAIARGLQTAKQSFLRDVYAKATKTDKS